MRDYRHGSHTPFAIHRHLVWSTKDRQKVLRGEVAEWVRAMVREECQKARVDILQGPSAPDHVHVMSSMPPHVTISRLIQRLQGQSSSRLLAEFPHRRQRFWGCYVWARGSFCCSSGHGTDEVIKAYMAQQSHDSDGVFRIEGETSPAGNASGEEPHPRF